MPRFVFQLRSESHVQFSEGTELDGLEDARIEAARRIGVVLTEHARQIWEDQDWRMDVTDDRGLILFSLQISVFDAASVGGGRR